MDSIALNGRWSLTGTTDQTKSAIAGKSIVVDHISGHTDADVTLALKQGSTTIAEWKIDVSVSGFDFEFNNPNGFIIAAGSDAVLDIDAGFGANVNVNVTGFTIP